MNSLHAVRIQRPAIILLKKMIKQPLKLKRKSVNIIKHQRN